MIRATLAAALVVGTTAVAGAHDYSSYGTRDIDTRRAWEARIENGLRSGQLTWREYFWQFCSVYALHLPV